ncbi:MAG: nucleotide exchange factor GrpE [Candidatus Zixiibacteriota bacterium]
MTEKNKDDAKTDKNRDERDEQTTNRREPFEDTGVESEKADSPEEVSSQAQPCTEEEMLRRRVAELEDKLLRNAAEFENYKKRVARQYEDMVRSANDAVMLEFLDIVDNFERALSHANNNADSESLRKGTDLILNQMINLLKKYNITPIEAVGKPFDPNFHDAMMQIESEDHDEGVVAMEMSRGYRQGDRILRHSKVGVSSGRKMTSDK